MTQFIPEGHTMWKFLKRQIDKVPSSPGLIQPGVWYVRYNDGSKSQNMTYDVCRDYAKLFGGDVFHVSDNG